AVVRTYPGQQGRHYRVATERDVEVAWEAEEELRRREKEHEGPLSLVPDEPLPPDGTLGFRIQKYGLRTWGDLFLPRQALTLAAFAAAVREARDEIASDAGDPSVARTMFTCLSIAVGRSVDYWASLCRWVVGGQFIAAANGGEKKLPMVWDFAEANPFSGSTGDWEGALEWVERVCKHGAASRLAPGQATQGDARAIPLPDHSVPCVFTDPPYYDAVAYANLSDFFYVWLRRSVGHLHPDLFPTPLAPKPAEIVVNPVAKDDGRTKDKAFFESEMRKALAEARRVLSPNGIGVVVFAHKSTSGWEAMLSALLDAGWTVTGSWPVDTERPGRLREQNSAALASSVHIVCRPRAERVGVGDWRQLRGELERRVAEWLPRLSEEGVEGADAIFACLGPALEVYSRFERVETASGDTVPLAPPEDNLDAPAFLPAVWSVVAREALRMIFEGPEAEGFEEDARLTALWLWTLRAAENARSKAEEPEALEEDEDEEGESKAKKLKGLVLDYDTARKLAQALGAHLQELDRPSGIVEVKKGAARLLPVAERRKTLLGEGKTPKKGGTLFEAVDVSSVGPFAPGETTLDRLHQAMLLFADGRGEALRRLLAEPGYAQDGRFRRLARALSSLYPSSSPEKRWVDGILAASRQAGG
ncbi:MAG: DUF1156 domain-containing protein, partial [Actinomycetota bacterium]